MSDVGILLKSHEKRSRLQGPLNTIVPASLTKLRSGDEPSPTPETNERAPKDPPAASHRRLRISTQLL